MSIIFTTLVQKKMEKSKEADQEPSSATPTSPAEGDASSGHEKNTDEQPKTEEKGAPQQG